MQLAVDKINRENLLFPSALDDVELVMGLDNGDGWMTARYGNFDISEHSSWFARLFLTCFSAVCHPTRAV